MVKCAKCGCVAIRDRKTGRFEEVDGGIRDTGKFSSQKLHDRYFTGLFCFRLSHDLQSETGFHAVEKNESAQVAARKNCLEKHRHCDKIIPWTQGFSPKEHVEMDMIERQRDWQRQCEESDRLWREQRTEEDRKWRESQEKNAANRHVETLRQASTFHWREIVVFGAIVTAIMVGTQLLSAYLTKPPVIILQPENASGTSSESE